MKHYHICRDCDTLVSTTNVSPQEADEMVESSLSGHRYLVGTGKDTRLITLTVCKECLIELEEFYQLGMGLA